MIPKCRAITENEDKSSQFDYGLVGICEGEYTIVFENGTGVFIKDIKTIDLFTRMYDKNKNEIYENDIVSAWSEGKNGIGIVKQRIDGLWIIFPVWQNGELWGLKPNENGYTTVEIIGNMHENPELIKRSEEDEIQRYAK